MGDHLEAIVPMGPAGSGKSHLGRHLAGQGVASYVEFEPLLRERFGAGEAFNDRIEAAGAFIWRSYRDQLERSTGVVVFESAGIQDRPLLEALQRRHRVALVRVDTPRAVCVDRVLARPCDGNISNTSNPEQIARCHDLWHERIAPTYAIVGSVPGTDTVRATEMIRSLLAGEG